MATSPTNGGGGRRAGVADSAYDHQVFNPNEEGDLDISEDEEDGQEPEKMSENFEFSNSYGVMRIIKLMLFLQTIAIVIDNPSFEMSILFRIVCRGFLFYSIRFYSRPFIDLIYVIETFLSAIVNGIHYLNKQSPGGNVFDNIQVSGARRLETNPYRPDRKLNKGQTFTVSFTDEANWHALKYYSHYILGITFFVLAIFFTIQFWEISDYSNRNEMKVWLGKYVADGWWRRGGAHVSTLVFKAMLATGFGMLLIQAISMQFGMMTIPNSGIYLSLLAVTLSVVFLVSVGAFYGIRITEKAFVRYVSQNVSYTSAIILKRAVKSKIELGLLFVILLFTPVLYTLTKGLLVFTDWNDFTSENYRKDVNFFVPGYYMAFPPYRQSELPPETCSYLQYSDPVQELRRGGK